MLKNKIIAKKIRNIFILFMAIIIMLGAYHNIRRSRAENVIKISVEVTDKSNNLGVQTVTVDATETSDGVYMINLPVSVNGNVVTKYYTADGEEMTMNAKSPDKITLELTADELQSKTVQLSTDYDTKEVTAKDSSEKELFYNKMLTSENGEVILSGYMPLSAELEVNEIDVSTLTDVVLPSDNQTMKKAYEFSLFKTEVVQKEESTETNTDTTETEKGTESEPQTQADTEENTKPVESNTTTNTTTNSTTETPEENTTTTTTTETPTDKTEEKTEEKTENKTTTETKRVEYKPEDYEEELKVNIKYTTKEENENIIIYQLLDNDTVFEKETTAEDDETFSCSMSKIEGESKLRYVLTTSTTDEDVKPVGPNPGENVGATEISGMLKSTSNESTQSSLFLDNPYNIYRRDIAQVIFTYSGVYTEDSSRQWDVSALGDNSVIAWYETIGSGDYRVYIRAASGRTIYANPNSSYLFAFIGNSLSSINDSSYGTETIQFNGLLDTSKVTNMRSMFYYMGTLNMTRLDLSGFNTSNVTNMDFMFWGIKIDCHDGSTFELYLGDKFYTSNVYSMLQMFCNSKIRTLYLGEHFDTSQVSDMRNMFYGMKDLTSLDLGPAFQNIGTYYSNLFGTTSSSLNIYVSASIYASSKSLKQNASTSTAVITITDGTIIQKYTSGGISTGDTRILKSTASENSYINGFLGNTSIQRQYIEKVIFVNSTSSANSTKWDVSAAGDNSVIAWYTGSNPYQVYIGSNGTIYANEDSRYFFAYIGYGNSCTATSVIEDASGIFDTSKVTNMSYMFYYTGLTAMTSLNFSTNLPNFTTSNVTNMTRMFYQTGWKCMTELNLGNKFDTSKVTNMNGMFTLTGQCEMKTLNLGSNFNTSKVTNMANMFNGCSSLTSLSLGNYFYTTNVTDMTSMFDSLGKYRMTTLDLGPAFTRIASTNSGFASNLGNSNTKIYVSNAIYQDTTHFKLNSSSSTTIEVTTGATLVNRDGSTAISGMLKSAASETSQISGFLGNTNIQRQYIEKVTFLNSTSSANSTKWDVSAAGDNSVVAWYTGSNPYQVYIGSNSTIYANPDSSYLFNYIGFSNKCGSKEVIAGLNLLNTSKATNMSYMFNYTGYYVMIGLDLGSNFDTSNVTNMDYMFCLTGYNAMKSLDLKSNFYTSKVTSMQGMFKQMGGVGLTTLTLGSHFDTSKVTDMSWMFCGMGSLTALDLGSYFYTSKVKNMDYMFFITGSEKMTTLKLGDNFNTTNVTSMSYMFSTMGTKALTTLDLGPAFTRIPSTNTDFAKDLGNSNTKIYVASDIYKDKTHFKLSYNSSTTIAVTSGATLVNRDGTGDGTLKSAVNEVLATSGFLGNTSIQRQYIEKVTFLNSTSSANSTKWDVSEAGDGSIMAWYTGSKPYQVYIGSNGTIYANENSSYLFSYVGYDAACTATDTIVNINLLNTSKATNMSNMFRSTGSNAMTSLYLGDNFDTRNVTNMNNMFIETGYHEMINFDLGNNFDTSKVTNMEAMFMNTGFESMTSLNLKKKFDTGNVTTMNHMFCQTGRNSMTSLILGDKFDTKNVKDMTSMFYAAGYYKLTSLSLGDKFDTGNVVTMENMFRQIGPSMTNLDLGAAFTRISINNTDFATGLGGSNTKIYVANEIYGDKTHFKLGDSSSTTIEVTTGATLVGKYNMPAKAVLRSAASETSDTSLFLNNPYGIQRKYIEKITFVSSKLDANNYSNWDVSAAGDKSVVAWYTGSNPYQVYIGSNTTIYANEDSSCLFSHIGNASTCTATDVIVNINLLNTSEVTNMTRMFYATGARAMTKLDLGDNFDTSNVTNMAIMFFETGYNSMTRLNLGDKFDTSNVTDMHAMFYFTGLVSLESLDLGNKFNTSNVTNMSTMFMSTGASKMTSLNLGSNFNTSNVTNMNAMFFMCGKAALTSLSLGNQFYTTNVTDMTSMFEECGNGAMTSLDFGPAFTRIADSHDKFLTLCGKVGVTYYVPESIYNGNSYSFKMSANSSTTFEDEGLKGRCIIVLKYQPTLTRVSATVNTTAKTLTVNVRGAVDSTKYTGNADRSIVANTTSFANNLKVYLDGELASGLSKSVSLVSSSSTGVQYQIVISGFETAGIKQRKELQRLEW